VLHAKLPPNKAAVVEIYNIFEPGDGDEVRFEETCTSTEWCLINGKRTRLSDYMREHGYGHMHPLVANYSGAMINTTFMNTGDEKGVVGLGAPVFRGVSYRFSKPIEDYPAEFQRVVPPEAAPAFSCNCAYNYFRGKLEGRKTAQLTGPVTFGEIAYQLLNQTCVALDFRDA
jgi:hypothetical protein